MFGWSRIVWQSSRVFCITGVSSMVVCILNLVLQSRAASVPSGASAHQYTTSEEQMQTARCRVPAGGNEGSTTLLPRCPARAKMIGNGQYCILDARVAFFL